VWRIDRSMSLFIHDSPLEAAGTSPLFSQPFLLSFIHSFCLGWWYVLSFFFRSDTCDLQGQIPRKQIKIIHGDVRRRFLFITREQASKRQETEISNLVQISFLPMLQIFSRLSFFFFIQNGSRTVATIFLSVQSPLCKSLEVPLSVRPSLFLSLSLSSCSLARPTGRVLKQTKHNRNCVENNKNKKKKNNG
jgi:hypothetical protein